MKNEGAGGQTPLHPKNTWLLSGGFNGNVKSVLPVGRGAAEMAEIGNRISRLAGRRMEVNFGNLRYD